MGILEEIVERTRADVDARRGNLEMLQMQADGLSVPRPFGDALARPANAKLPKVISEIKRASPSKGPIRPDLEPADIAKRYAAAGASAISVLTEPHWFKGSLADMQAARKQVDIPVLRKDFIVDAYQVWEARANHADAILLIVAALSDEELSKLHQLSTELGLGVLVEAHSREEAQRAADIGALVIGVNHRDLRTFEMHMDLLPKVKEAVPETCVLVAESGIGSRADLEQMVSYGADAVLVGEALMRAEDPGAELKGWLA